MLLPDAALGAGSGIVGGTGTADDAQPALARGIATPASA